MGKQISLLRCEMEQLKKKFEITEKRLEKAEFERNTSVKYVDSVREQIRQLHEKLTVEKTKNEDLEKMFLDHKAETRTDIVKGV